MLNWIKSREDECAEKQKETEESSREIDSLQKKSGEFEAGAEYKKALADRKRLNEVINEINLLKISFRNSFGSIDKPMKKYLHDFPSSAEKMVEKYFYEPVEGLAADEGLKILEILSGLETQLRNGKIMPEQRDKLLERTSALAGEIPVTAEKIKKLNAEKEAFASTKFILDNAEELKSRIAMKQKQIEALKFEIGRLGAEIIKKREWVEKSKKELEEKLKNVGILVRLGEGTGKTNNQA
jgi:hypothetical protein